ncbi:fibroin heavy chain-like [Schistocerca gregaria]|uniref:fibroin heavy chain-like n=1 Tax=Schistocerca gregaria TaxID=7010 RepID=UPI00211EF0AE|nr:fibroin heavy chain-like [Schistocerca gregaria]
MGTASAPAAVAASSFTAASPAEALPMRHRHAWAQQLLLSLLLLLLACSSRVAGQQAAPPEGSEYLDVRPNGDFRFGYNNGPPSLHFHTATSRNGVVQGRWGERSRPDTVYSAGPRGYRVRGAGVHRRMDLSQAAIPYRPPVQQDSPQYQPTYSGYHDPNENPSYQFTINERELQRTEDSDALGRVKGRYSFVDDAGERHTVEYVAGSGTGFQVLTAHPDLSAGGPLFVQAPPGRARPGDARLPRGRSEVTRRLDGTYSFKAAGPTSRREEASDRSGVVRGSYTYLDDKGVQRTTEYIAGPNIGYKVVSMRKGPVPYLPPTNSIGTGAGGLGGGGGGVGGFEGLSTAASGGTGRPTPPTASTPGAGAGSLFESSAGTTFPAAGGGGGAGLGGGAGGFPGAGGGAGGGTTGTGSSIFNTRPQRPTTALLPAAGSHTPAPPGGGGYTDQDIFGGYPSGGPTGGTSPSGSAGTSPAATGPTSRPSTDDDIFGGFGSPAGGGGAGTGGGAGAGSGGSRPPPAGGSPFGAGGRPSTSAPGAGVGAGSGTASGGGADLFGGNDDLFGDFGTGGGAGGGSAGAGSALGGAGGGASRPPGGGGGFGGDEDLFGAGFGGGGSTPGAGGGSRIPYKDCCTTARTASSPASSSAARSLPASSSRGGDREGAFSGFPPGVAVRAHVQSLDILPFGHRLPPPGLALETLGRRRAVQDLLDFGRG